jgi:lysophospholipase L1-like esterase
MIFVDDYSWCGITLTHERQIGSDTTLLVLGDSWAWGDELGGSNGIDPKVDNVEYRMQTMFGHILAAKLNANWVQSALPGASYLYVVTELAKLLPRIAPHVGKVIVVMCFPDHGREVNLSDRYKELLHTDGMGLLDVTRKIETEYYNEIERIIAPYNNVTCIAGPTFTDPIRPHKFNTPKIWTEIMIGKTNVCYNFTSGIWAIADYLNQEGLMTDKRKEEFMYITDSTFDRLTLMKGSGLFFERVHPKEEGHRQWANYLYEYLNESK